MLIVYLEQLELPQRQLLEHYGDLVNYWPRSWVNTQLYNAAIPSDWWILFHNSGLADIWLMKYPENSRVIRTLLD